jgi:exopolyphosphatase / guanosine-5'-triphosphate,3'-diphosphate pyrophosphatase
VDNFIAMIDLGSNSARLVVYKQDPHGLMFEFDNIKQVLRLSAHLTEEGKIDETGLQKTLHCMEHFKRICEARHVTEIVGVATAAVRQAKNGPQLIAQIREQTGISIRILSGEEEAFYGYLAIVNSMKVRDAFTVDIGGGSTEVTFIKNRKCKKVVSFPFGAITLTRRFLKHDIPTPLELQTLEQFLLEEFAKEPFLSKHPGVPLIALGGAARNVANVHQKKNNYPFSSLHQYAIEPADVTQLFLTFASTPIEKRKKIKGLSKDRGDIIVASSSVFHTLLSVIGGTEFMVSTKGLRDGILFERILQDQHTALLEDVALYSTRELMKRYQVNTVRAEHIAALSLSLFDQFQQANLLVATSDERKLLQIAALLHEIGHAINAFETSQHTFYMLTNVQLFGLSHHERLIIAMIASYKSEKKLQKQFAHYQDILSIEEFEHIKRLAMLLWTARSLGRIASQQVRELVLSKVGEGYRMTTHGLKEDLVEYTLLGEIQEQFTKTYHQPFVLEL